MNLSPRTINVSYKTCISYTSLVLLGSTTASQRALAAAQAAELGGKEKALTGFRGFLATACRRLANRSLVLCHIDDH